MTLTHTSLHSPLAALSSLSVWIWMCAPSVVQRGGLRSTLGPRGWLLRLFTLRVEPLSVRLSVIGYLTQRYFISFLHPQLQRALAFYLI